jgi:hypothetical protein
MDQNNNLFNNNPQPPTDPRQPAADPSGAQVYEIPPTYQQPGGPAYTPPPPPNNSRRTWLIVLIVLLVLCCCCVIALVVAWNTGDSLLINMCQSDPTLPFCDQIR